MKTMEGRCLSFAMCPTPPSTLAILTAAFFLGKSTCILEEVEIWTIADFERVKHVSTTIQDTVNTMAFIQNVTVTSFSGCVKISNLKCSFPLLSLIIQENP